MIKHIYTLKREYADREIYIWDVSQRAIWVFEPLAFRKIRISGFVTDMEEFYGNEILNMPVIPLLELEGRKDVLLLCDTNEKENTVSRLNHFCQTLRLNDAYELNPELNLNSCYMYGTGKNAWAYLKKWTEKNSFPKAFLQTLKERDQILQVPVLQISEADLKADDSILVSVSVVNEILTEIDKKGFSGDVYIEELVLYHDLWSQFPFQMLDQAVKKKKKIFFCSSDSLSRELFYDIFNLYDIPISKEVSMKYDPENGLEDIYSLADENPQDSVLFLHHFLGDKRLEMAEAAESLGFSEEYGNCASIYPNGYSRRKWSKELVYETDKRLGFSIDYSQSGGLPGWEVYGDRDRADIAIMVLGGSTSSEVYRPRNWVHYLYQRLCREGYSVCVYNGAHEANAVLDEMLRMVRDLSSLNPDIVISMSGVNDLDKEPDKFSKYNPESTFARWRRYEAYMKDIAEMEGASFYAFLQPVNKCSPEVSFEENLFFIADSHYRGRIFETESKDDDFYCNLLSLFLHREGMYIDAVHYSDAAHQELSEIVFKEIEPEVIKRCRRK